MRKMFSENRDNELVSDSAAPPATPAAASATQAPTPAADGRTALLRATVTVVANHGMRHLTYRSVAAEAGVSHSLVRHHFGSRDQMLADALDFAVTESLRESNMLTTGARIEDFAAGIESLAERRGDAQVFQYQLLLESRHRTELAPHVERYYATYRDATTTALTSMGVRDRALIDTIWFALDGLVFASLVHPVDARGVIERIRTLLTASLTSSIDYPDG